MTLRPARQLRFRSQEQFEQLTANALKSGKSLNEYILLAVEYAEKSIKLLKPQQPTEGA